MEVVATRIRRRDLHLRTGSHYRPGRLILTLLTALLITAALPAAAAADGPVTPTATNYLARVTHEPRGVQAKVVDGYLNLWMQVPAHETVVVLDFEGAPWVRFDPAGVQINLNSEEYYLSQVPVPAIPPKGLTRNTTPRWRVVSSGHSYMWREGRLHALATIALAPGASYVGPWTIAVTVNGHPGSVSGGIWHTGPPSPIWFWPILVMLACAVAAWRVRSPALDRRLGRILLLVLLALIAIGMAGRYLHGRPGIQTGNVILLAVILVALAAAAGRALSGKSGLPLLAATAIVALWAGLTLITTLTHGYVLLATPALVARTVTAALLGGSLSLALIGVRALDRVRT
jgi:hypothetical protein